MLLVADWLLDKDLVYEFKFELSLHDSPLDEQLHFTAKLLNIANFVFDVLQKLERYVISNLGVYVGH